MPKKRANLEPLLADLSQERDALDAAIESMMADMAQVPPEQRSSSDWASDGVRTRQFLDLTNRQAEVEREIVALSQEILVATKPTLPN